MCSIAVYTETSADSGNELCQVVYQSTVVQRFLFSTSQHLVKPITMSTVILDCCDFCDLVWLSEQSSLRVSVVHTLCIFTFPIVNHLKVTVTFVNRQLLSSRRRHVSWLLDPASWWTLRWQQSSKTFLARLPSIHPNNCEQMNPSIWPTSFVSRHRCRRFFSSFLVVSPCHAAWRFRGGIFKKNVRWQSSAHGLYSTMAECIPPRSSFEWKQR